MFMVIPTWLVTLNYGDAKGVTFRVPEPQLDAFLRVMTFSKQEFEVARQPEYAAETLGMTQEAK